MKVLTHYKIKDFSMCPLYNKGDDLELQKTENIEIGEIVIIQTRVKIFVGEILPSKKIGFLAITEGLKKNIIRFIFRGKKKFYFYHILRKISK